MTGERSPHVPVLAKTPLGLWISKFLQGSVDRVFFKSGKFPWCEVQASSFSRDRQFQEQIGASTQQKLRAQAPPRAPRLHVAGASPVVRTPDF